MRQIALKFYNNLSETACVYTVPVLWARGFNNVNPNDKKVEHNTLCM